jgi:hypothetical protein
MMRRGNAGLVFDSVTKSAGFCAKRGTGRGAWNWAMKNRLPETEERYTEQVTKPLTKAFIDRNAGVRHLYDN